MNAALRHAAACLLLPLCAAAGAVQDYEVRVLERKPQSREHFVQGLEIVDDKLYVSTGTYGGSGLYRYDFDDMRPQGARRLDRRIFAEGVTVLGERIYQLTWRNGRVPRVFKATHAKSGITRGKRSPKCTASKIPKSLSPRVRA